MDSPKNNPRNGPVPETSSTMLRDLANGADSVRWTEFVDLYTPVLAYWLQCLRNGPLPSLSPDMFDDIIQETMVSLMKLFPQRRYDRDRARFRTLLQTILRKRALDCLEDSGNARLRFMPDEEMRFVREERSVPGFDGNENDEESRQLRSELSRLIVDRVFRKSNFSGRSKAIFMRLAAGESVAVLSEEYGVDRNAIYQIKNRVVAKLTEKARELQRESGDILDMICALEREGESNDHD